MSYVRDSDVNLNGQMRFSFGQTLINRFASLLRGERTINLGLIAAALMALPLILLFTHSGLPVAADSEIHLQRISSVLANFEAGHLWARWTPYLHQGFGYPIHNFYAPGLHLLGALLALIFTGLDLVAVYKLLLFASILLYPLGAYLWTRRDFGTTGALVAAAAYLYTPFRFHELLAQQNLSQFAAMALLPYLLWAIRRAADQPVPRAAALIAALYGVMILLHHPTALLFSPFAGIYVLILLCEHLRLPSRRLMRLVGVIAAGLLLGAALSAAFWLPALLELRYTQISTFQTGVFSVHANFVAFDELIAGIPMTDQSRFGLPLMLRAGQLQIIAVIVALVSLMILRRKASTWTPRAKWTLAFGAVAVGICLFLITPASEGIWTHLPLANLIVYPWRLLGIIAVMALPGAAALPALVQARWRNAAAGGIIACLFAASLPLLVIPPTFTNATANNAQDEMLYEQRTGNVGLTSGDEYLPIWAEERPLAPPPDDYSTRTWHVDVQSTLPAAVLTPQNETCSNGSSCYTVDPLAEIRVTLAQLYFPGWIVAIDGESTEIQPTAHSGLISFTIPAGSHTILIAYTGTTIQHIGEAITLTALVLLLILCLWHPSQNAEHLDLPQEASNHRLALGVGVAMTGFALLNLFYITPHTDWFRFRSDPAAPPAQMSVHAVFGDTIELLGYDLPTNPAIAGETIPIRLYWRLLQPTNVGLRGGVALTSAGGRDVWANSNSLNLGGGVSTISWTLDQYVVDSYLLNIAPDAPPYVGELRVSVFTQDEAGGIHYLPLPSGESAAVIGSVRLSGDDPPSDLTAVQATFAEFVTLTGYAFSRDGDQQCITLRWIAERGDLPELAVMLHLQDQSGTLLAAADSAPLDDRYPTSLWQAGQHLNDRHCFTPLDQAVDLAVGLYRRSDGQRLNITHIEGASQADNALLLSLVGS